MTSLEMTKDGICEDTETNLQRCKELIDMLNRCPEKHHMKMQLGVVKGSQSHVCDGGCGQEVANEDSNVNQHFKRCDMCNYNLCEKCAKRINICYSLGKADYLYLSAVKFFNQYCQIYENKMANKWFPSTQDVIVQD